MIRPLLYTLAISLAAFGQAAAQGAPSGVASSPPADVASPGEAATPSPPVPKAAAPKETVPAPAVNSPSPGAPPAKPAPHAQKQDESTQSILGTQVRGENGDSIGRLVDVFVDKAGVPREALLDIGGFLGVGSRRIVVPWQTLHFNPDSKDQMIAISMTGDQLKAAPEYKGVHPPPAAPPSKPAAATPAKPPASPPAASPSPPAAPAPAPASPAPPAAAGAGLEAPAGPAPSPPAPGSKPPAPSQ